MTQETPTAYSAGRRMGELLMEAQETARQVEPYFQDVVAVADSLLAMSTEDMEKLAREHWELFEQHLAQMNQCAQALSSGRQMAEYMKQAAGNVQALFSQAGSTMEATAKNLDARIETMNSLRRESGQQ